MAKKRLTVDQRGRISEKVMEWGNLVFAGFVIGQFVSGESFQFVLAAIGIVGMLLAYAFAYYIMKGGARKK